MMPVRQARPTLAARCLGILALLSLPACVAAAVGTAGVVGVTKLMAEVPSNVIENNNYAADALARQANQFVTPPVTISIEPPLNADRDGNEATPLGHVIATQLSSRFSQLGYRVADPVTGAVKEPLRAQPGSAPRGAPAYGGPGAVHDIVLRGYYTIASGNLMKDGDVWVTLRILEANSGRVLATQDYTMVYNKYIRALEFPADTGDGSTNRGQVVQKGNAARSTIRNESIEDPRGNSRYGQNAAEPVRGAASLKPVTLAPLAPPDISAE